ncbi:MAG TPA: arginase family protein [Nitrososphaera sp.]|nr:arginase family protein [Nitrososphaera sp.]
MKRKGRQLSLIGVPTNSAGKRNGVANAPAALRRAGLVEILGAFCQVRDEGNVSFSMPTVERDAESGIIAYSSLASMVRSVRTSVSHALKEGRFPLVIGGDCPILLGCLAASVETFGPIGLLFGDGHEDSYPPHQSPTGEAADMELGFALGLEVPDLIREAIGSVPLINAPEVCLLGPRDKKILQKTNVRSLDDDRNIEYYDDTTLRKGNIEALMSKVTRQLASKVKGLWLHVDLDVLSTRSLPAVDYQQPGGLSWSQLESLTKTALSSGNVMGLNVTIYNPDLDSDKRFAKRIVKYLQTMLASMD